MRPANPADSIYERASISLDGAAEAVTVWLLQGAAASKMADIIGLSCRFPESNGPSEFWSNLMNGKDMVTADDRRWPVGFQGLPPRTGKLPGFDKFDAAFFSVHGKQAQVSFLLMSNEHTWPYICC